MTKTTKMWKCGKCGKEYTSEEFIRLPSVPLVPEDKNPMEQHGYTPVCKCGYVFHRDRWHLVSKVKLRECVVKVSTIFLELNHGFGDEDLWYETMIFSDKPEIECYFCERYKTKQEAIKGHKRIVKLLKECKYEIKPIKFELKLKES